MPDRYANLSDEELLEMANRPPSRAVWQAQSYGAEGRGMNPAFVSSYEQPLEELFYQRYQQPIHYISGYRPRWREEQIWRSGVRPSVPPWGTSRHTGYGHGGEALDVAPEDIAKVNALPLQQIGMETLARINDPGHVQAIRKGYFPMAQRQVNYEQMSDEDLLALANQGSVPQKSEKKAAKVAAQPSVPVPADFGQTEFARKYPQFGAPPPPWYVRAGRAALPYAEKAAEVIDIPHRYVSEPVGKFLAKALPDVETKALANVLPEQVAGKTEVELEPFNPRKVAETAIPFALDWPVYGAAGRILSEGTRLAAGGAKYLNKIRQPYITENLGPGFFARGAKGLPSVAGARKVSTLEIPQAVPGTAAAAEAAAGTQSEVDQLLSQAMNISAPAGGVTAPAAGASGVSLMGPGSPWKTPSPLDVAAGKMGEQMGIIGRRGFPPQLRPKYGDQAAIDAEWRTRQAGGYGAGPIGKAQLRQGVYPPITAPKPPIDFQKIKKIEQSIGLNIRGIDPGVNQNLRLIDTLGKYGGEPTVESVIHEDPMIKLWNEMLKRGGG